MDTEQKRERIKELVDLLSKASEAYYKNSEEIITNFEYDKLYDELETLEKETGLVLAKSPTQTVGYETLSELPKERHPQKMLSLDKTKEVAELESWLGDKEGLLSWKLDGLTVVLTYSGGELVKAVTRGNGEIGEVITPNARVFSNLPVTIPYKGEVVLRGEAIITYSEFERINESLPELDAKYKNPRNLSSGSVRQLNNEITAQRNVRFIAFALVEGPDDNSAKGRFEWLEGQGFEVVEFKEVTAGDLEKTVREFEAKIPENDYPSDGLVLMYEDIDYGKSLGATSKFPRDSIAFKWRDEVRETTLTEIEWSVSRTGLINPIAVFEPVELEGTTVKRASVHNVSILKELALGIGDRIKVYKANMIIPQITENLTRSAAAKIPRECPVCGKATRLSKSAGAEVLYCDNEECPAKSIKSLALFVSRDGMNIEGLSESTLEKLTARGIVKEPADLFRLAERKKEISEIEGLGEKSFENLYAAAESARENTPARLLYSLGIPGIGAANAAQISKAAGEDWEKMTEMTKEELLEIDGVGEVLADAYIGYFGDSENLRKASDIAGELIFVKSASAPQNLVGMTFVITGSLTHFENRKELEEVISSRGGKTSGSVSKNTDFLINNDPNSTSSKNKKAAELGIEIITEDEFMERFETDA